MAWEDRRVRIISTNELGTTGFAGLLHQTMRTTRRSSVLPLSNDSHRSRNDNTVDSEVSPQEM
jgi:hypothetical protein